MTTSFAMRFCGMLLLTLFSFISKAQLSANFKASPQNGCAPLLVGFQDETTGNPTSWKWDLGNGTISFLQNPSVTYFNPGFYTIQLVVKNASGSDSVLKIQFINVAAKPTAQFTASTTSGCFPLPVQFTDESIAESDSIVTWQWDFGDGYSSAIQSPHHVYTGSGDYNVTLRVINNKGCINTLSKSKYIHINDAAKANFSNNTPNFCRAPVTIDFQNISTGTGILTYEWLFGDGTTSITANPSHVYSDPGTYTLALIATNAIGCKDTLIKPNAFTVGNVFPSFAADDQICAGVPTLFSNTSTPTPSSVSWYFGDGTSTSQSNPVKTYSNAGDYQIKLVANFGSCLDSVVKTISVIPSPKASFTADDSTSCSLPFTVNFSEQASNAISYQWDFGDGTYSSSASPSHTYKYYGKFKVQLVVTSANGCTDTLRKANFINVVKPQIIFKNLPDSGCVPFTKNFSSNVTSIDAVTAYHWDFGDGGTSSNQTPVHIYTLPGIYTVTLIIYTAEGCSDTAFLTRAIVTNSRPTAAFSATPKDACAKTPVDFTDESTGNAIKWLWQFGDGATSTAQNPRHIFVDTGFFDVQLIIWNSGCQDTIKHKSYVHINAPVARFTVPIDCKIPLERKFADNSIGADEWNWDFGDGTTSTLKNPVHTYALPGLYDVSLLVRNHNSGCDDRMIQAISIVNATAGFFASDTIICKGKVISFTSSEHLAQVKSFNWKFGDGISANSTTSNTVPHLYTSSGNYNVRLIITDKLGCIDSVTKSSYIRINGPTARFAPSVPGSCLNSLITFNDASVSDNINPIQTWSWNYGDGTTELLSAPPFQHNYSTPGAYLVTLKVVDAIGCADSVTINRGLIISRPVASFTALDSISCPSKQVTFTNQSTGPGLNYLWNFGDGSTSVVQTPLHNYLVDGIYTVQLSIQDQFGCTDSIIKPGAISIITPVADFTMSDSFSICPPLIIQFDNRSVNSASQKWDFGDGTSSSIANPSHFYNYPGTYTITLMITAVGGCTDVKKKDIVVRGPRGTFVYDPLIGCNPVKIDFIGTTQDRMSFIWDFNDGTTVSTTDSLIAHTYTNPGTYLPKMILIDANGCQVPIAGKDTITVNGVTARFSFLDKPLCDRGNISFVNTSVSNDVITSYKWLMGDNTSSIAQAPQHYYNSTGKYYPKLVVTTLHGCMDSMLSSIPVKVVASPRINITSTSSGCTPLNVTFKGLIVVADTSSITWYWNFGNGNFSTTQNPNVQTFDVAGIYAPYAIGTNSSGCSDTAANAIEAYLIPPVNAGLDTIVCKRSGTTLQSSGATNYSWGPSAGLSCINCANPVATPDSTRNYFVKGTSVHGCTATDTVLVKVLYPFKIKYSNTDTLCLGQTVKLFASGTDEFQWTPATGLNNPNIAFPIGIPQATVTYRVVGTDSRGCFKDTGYVIIKVYPIPLINAGSDKTINTGQTLDLVPQISADVSTVTWSPTGSIFRNFSNAISVKPRETTEYTAEVKNGGGCMARDKVTVFVICNGTNVFIPNTFSPNGDGANDVFYPRGTGLFKIKSMRLFNRWGQVVFERNDFNANDAAEGWNGTYRGAKLSADVFVYTIDILCDNNTVLTYKGNVALIQ
ncbi:MAG: PKD domain-containing protein [Ferruginibacter sp.]